MRVLDITTQGHLAPAGRRNRAPTRLALILAVSLCLVVAAGMIRPASAASLTVGTPTASPASVDSAQSIALSASFSGGTSPYTCQWTEEAPGATSFSPLGSAATCTSPSSATTGLLSTVGTWQFELDVNSVPSSPVYVTVVAAPLVTLSPTSLDAGQSGPVTATVTWSAGTSPFTVYLLSTTSSTSSCPNSAPGGFTLVGVSGSNPLTGQTSTTVSFSFTSPGMDVWYCAVVEDHFGVVYPSLTQPFTENQALTRPTISGALTIDSGQAASLSTSTGFSGGTQPYTCQWLEETPTAHTFADLGGAFSCAALSLPTASTGALTAVGTWQFELQVTDSSPTPYTVVSTDAVAVLVNPALSVATPAAVASTLDSGQATTLSATFSGGTSTYTCQWLAKMPAASSFSDLGAAFTSGCTAGATLTQSTGALAATGTWQFELQVTDSAALPVTTSSAAFTATVNPVLSAGAISPNLPSIDKDQGVVLTSAAGGGTLPYTYQWYTAGCAGSDKVAGATQPSYSATPLVTTTYYYVVTDAAGASSGCSSGDTVTVSSAPLDGPTIGVAPNDSSTPVSQTTIDAGQMALLSSSSSFTGGTAGYTCQWFEEEPGATSFSSMGLSFSCVVGTLPAVPTGTLTVGTWQFELKISDDSMTPATVASNVVSVIVDTDPLVTSFSLTPPIIPPSTPTTITAAVFWEGGTGPYSVTLYEGSSSLTSGTCASAGAPVTTTEHGPDTKVSLYNTSALFTFSYSGSMGATEYYCAVVTDSSPGTSTSSPPPNTAASSVPFVTVDPPPSDPKTSLSASCLEVQKDVWDCTAALKKFGGSVAGEEIYWSQLGGPGRLTFSSVECALSAKGRCGVTVTGTSAGAATVEAVYGGDLVNANSPSYAVAALSVTVGHPLLFVSCTRTSMGVGSSMQCTATLKGFAGSVAGETVQWTMGGSGGASLSSYTCTLSSKGTCSVTVTGAAAGKVIVDASYSGDGLNLQRSATRAIRVK